MLVDEVWPSVVGEWGISAIDRLCQRENPGSRSDRLTVLHKYTMLGAIYTFPSTRHGNRLVAKRKYWMRSQQWGRGRKGGKAGAIGRAEIGAEGIAGAGVEAGAGEGGAEAAGAIAVEILPLAVIPVCIAFIL